MATKLSSLTFRGLESNTKQKETIPEQKTKGVLRLTKEGSVDGERMDNDANSFNKYGKKSSRVTFQEDLPFDEEKKEKKSGKKSKKFKKEKYVSMSSISGTETSSNDDFFNTTTETTFL